MHIAAICSERCWSPVVSSVAAGRYAQAAFEVAVVEDDLDAWIAAVETLEALTSEKRFVRALSQVEDARFQAIVAAVLPRGSPSQMNFLRLLRQKRRLSLGPPIAQRFVALVEAHQGILRAEITTAQVLDEGQEAGIVARLSAQTGAHIRPKFRVDGALIGGAIIQIGDRKIDGSMRAKFQSLRSDLSASQ